MTNIIKIHMSLAMFSVKTPSLKMICSVSDIGPQFGYFVNSSVH